MKTLKTKYSQIRDAYCNHHFGFKVLCVVITIAIMLVASMIIGNHNLEYHTLVWLVIAMMPMSIILGIQVIWIVTLRWSKIAMIGIIIIYILMITAQLLPIRLPFSQATGDMKSNVVYVTYSDNCSYCDKAESPMLRAVNMWNLTQSTPVKLVNLDTNHTNVGNTLRREATYKGSILMKGSDHIYQKLYTQGNAKGPITPSADHIYNRIKGMVENIQ